MSTDNPVRVALLGCGAIAQAHLRAIAANPGVVEVAGIYDADRSRAEARAAEFHVAHIYNTWHDVLASDADVIAVLLPHDLHAKFAVEVLEAGHHVVVEKPLATTLAECDAILNAASKAGKRAHPVHNRIYDPGTDAAREFIKSGAIGDIFLAQTVGLEPPQTVSVRPWLGTKAGGGGVLMAQAVHPAYLLRWILGDLSEATSIAGARKVLDMTSEDTAIAVYRFQQGAIAEMTGTFGMNVGPWNHRVTFYGPDGYVEICNREGVRGLSERHFGDREIHPLLPDLEWGTGFARMWADYANGFRTGAPTRVSGLDGRAAVEMILAAYESSKSRRTIDFPLPA